jgi:hypothetical protein
VDLKDKVAEALRQALRPDHLQLDDDDGVWGFVVSTQFRQMPALERQVMIENALRNSAFKLTKAELRNVLAIAPLTPAEFEAMDRGEPSGRRSK